MTRFRCLMLLAFLSASVGLLSSGHAETESCSVADQIGNAAEDGYGNHAGHFACYRGVKSIIAAGVGKKLSCVRSVLSGGFAADATSDLLKAGFVKKGSAPSDAACHEKGAVDVYKGAASAVFQQAWHHSGTKAAEAAAAAYMREKYHVNMIPGDYAGHIEVVGGNGGYYSYLKAYRPMSAGKLGQSGRRQLEGCYVFDQAAFEKSELGKKKNCDARGVGCGVRHESGKSMREGGTE